jgi:hypothetical protein
MKTIGKEWTKKEEGGMFTADHLSPSQLNKNIDQWKALPSNLKMEFGGLIGQYLQLMITHNLTLDEVMKGKK